MSERLNQDGLILSDQYTETMNDAVLPYLKERETDLQVEGFEDLSYNASVTRVLKVNNEVLAEFEVNEPVGPMLYQRSGRVSLSTELTGLSVTSKALSVQNGQAGVWLNDVPGGTFVAVEVLANDGSNALIRPLLDGALQLGQYVIIK